VEKKIMTVSGPVAPENLGFTSMHDHIMFNGSVLGKRLRASLPPHKLPISEHDKVSLDNVGILHRNIILAWDALNQDDEDAMTREVALFKKAGGDAILELSVPGILLDTAAAKRISEKTGVKVVVSTGFYTGDSWPENLHGKTVSEYRAHMLYEIQNGVQRTDIHPGHLKIGLENLDQDEENALRAAAQVGKETGLALTIHPCAKCGGDSPHILRILKEEGMDITRVVMAHTSFSDKPPFAHVIRHPSDYRVNLDRAKALLDTGCTISKEFLNTMGLELIGEYDGGDWSEMSGLVRLIDQGYCKQIVIGNDCCGKIMLHNFGGEGFCRMLYYTLPMLRDVAGVADYALRQIFCENPARILSY
jgi:phosphotriesterase-related protein